MPTLGAAAVVVADAERAANSFPPPVYVLGTGYAQAPGIPGIEGGDLSTTTPVTASAEAAFRMAGIPPPDIGLVLLYDCYTIAGIIQLEDAGFCSKGEGGQLIASTDCTYAVYCPSTRMEDCCRMGTRGTQAACRWSSKQSDSYVRAVAIGK